MEKRNFYSIGILLVMSAIFLGFYQRKKQEEPEEKQENPAIAVMADTKEKEESGSYETTKQPEVQVTSEVTPVPATPTVQETEEQEKDRVGIVATNAVNVRQSPKKDAPVIQILEKETRVTITDQSQDGWYEIELENQTGYVYSEYITVPEAE